MAAVENQQQEERHFKELNTLINKFIMNRNGLDDINVKALEEIIQSFKRNVSFKKNVFHTINLAEPAYACAYVHRYGTLTMGLVRFRALEALRKSEELREMFTSPEKPNVNVVSLGGGPGIDVVGLTSALYECKIGSHLNVTILDSVLGWSPFVDLLQKYIREGNYGNASEYFRQYKVKVSFMESQLPFNAVVNQDSRDIIKNADVILMIRFLARMQVPSFQVIQQVWENMRPGAIVLLIDTPFYPASGEWCRFEQLYLHMIFEDEEEYQYDGDVLDDEGESRFRREDATSSKSHVAVLRKY